MNSKAKRDEVRLSDPTILSFGRISLSGALQTASLIRLIGGSFETGNLPVDTWLTQQINSAPLPTAITGELLLRTGTTADGESLVQSVNRAELIDSTSNNFLAFAQHLDFNAANNVTEWGLGDPIANIFSGDAGFFRNTGGVISIVFRKAGVESVIPEAAFNGSTLTGLDNSFVKDNNVHAYEAIYTLGRVAFLQDSKLIHLLIVTTTGAVETLHLPVFTANRNINANITDNTFKLRSLSCSRIGSGLTETDTHTFNSNESILLKNSPGKLLSVIITDTGVGGASLELFDALDGSGTPFATVNLTEDLVELNFNRTLNIGLFVVAAGNSFEVIVNWR